MDDDIKDRLKSGNLWARALYMVFFAIVSVIARAVITLLAVVQFIVVVLTGRANEAMLQLGSNLSEYAAQIIRYVTFNTDALPFPFSAWPDEGIDESPWLDDEPPAAPAPPAARPEAAAVPPEASTGPDRPADTDPA